MKLRIQSLLPVIALLLLAGCGPPWRVVRESGPPSALTGAQLIGVSFDWSRAMVGGVPEALYLGGLPPDEQANYMEVHSAIESAYFSELQRHAGGVQIVPSTGAEPVQLVVQPLTLELGYYRVIVARDSRLDVAAVFLVGGQPTDEIEVRATRPASMRNATVLGRMTDAAARDAQLTAQFIRRARDGG
ncbi:MAG: hypothetical protein M3Y87_08665 [Myxococcota bacterium]|nr:hypothetical protein [Myxococcota bacterium]